MLEITLLVSELNELCTQYVVQKKDLIRNERIRELITDILSRDFDFEIFNFEKNIQHRKMLSDEGKKEFNTMFKITKLKLDAIHNYHYEEAALLREKERRLTIKINTVFFNENDKHYFILKDKSPNSIVFIDPDRHLKGMFK